MTTVHTPGPWKMVFTGPASTPDWHIQTGDGRAITILMPTSTKTAEAARANARLIAKAPDMHQLLAEALRETELCETDEPLSGADLVEWFCIWRAKVKACMVETR